jgi:homoserine O-acetyltransferase/O-succinyltransferase
VICRIGAVVLTTFFLLAPVASKAQPADIILEKKTFEMPSYATVAGDTIKSVKIGWEAAGTLNADKSNAILITHYFSGTSHAFGKYATSDKAAGYWDAIIGPGKAIDTNKYYVLSSDTLVNLNAKMPNVVTTGPASINPDTGKPYGLSFPVVSIKDFVRVQKALIDSLGIKKLKAVMGASMGGLQAYEWAQSYPDTVERIIPVIASASAEPFLIAQCRIVRLMALSATGLTAGMKPCAGICHPRVLADNRNTRARRRPYTSPQTRQSAAQYRRRTSDRPR